MRKRRATITIEWSPSDAYPNAEYVLWATMFPDLPVKVKIENDEDVPPPDAPPSVKRGTLSS